MQAVSFYPRLSVPYNSIAQGMTLSYQSKSGKSQVRVEFDPPLLGYDEVKPRLLSMKADAEESLGMVRLVSFLSLPHSTLSDVDASAPN